MEDLKEVELIVATRDEGLISDVERSLPSVNVKRGRPARALDPVTILAIAAGAVKLINELLSLKDKLKEWKKPPQIKVRVDSGEPVDLATVDREQLTRLLSGN